MGGNYHQPILLVSKVRQTGLIHLHGATWLTGEERGQSDGIEGSNGAPGKWDKERRGVPEGEVGVGSCSA